MRRLLLAAALSALGPAVVAQDVCLFLCDEQLDLTGAEAAARLEGWLEAPLPSGTAVEHLVEGGFQDAFIRVRLDADAAGLAALLAATGLADGDLRPVGAAALSPEEPDWWDWKLRPGVRMGEGSLPRMPFATLHVAPAEDEAGHWALYLWAFQT